MLDSTATQLIQVREQVITEVINVLRPHIDKVIADTLNTIENNFKLTYIEAEEFNSDELVGGNKPLSIKATETICSGLAMHYWQAVCTYGE